MHVFFLHLHTLPQISFFFFFNDPATTEIYPLPLHDALPICDVAGITIGRFVSMCGAIGVSTRASMVGCTIGPPAARRSEEHTSELQSPCNLVCRLLLEKKKKNNVQAYCHSGEFNLLVDDTGQ